MHAVFDGSRCALEGNGEASAGIFFAAFDYCGDDCCKFFIAFRERHRSLGLHFKASLLARPRPGPDDDVVERMALTTALELEPIDDRAGKPEGLRLRKHRKRIVGCDFCLKLRTCRSRRSRAGVFLWFSGSRHLLAQMIKAISARHHHK